MTNIRIQFSWKSPVLSLLLLGLLCAEPIAAQSLKKIDLGLQFALRQVVQPKLSFGADMVVYVVTTQDLTRNEFVNDLWLTAVEDKQTRQLTFDRPDVRKPSWSTDDRAIFFLAQDKNKVSQIFRLELAGGEARQITQQSKSISDYKLSPDGQWIAMIAKQEAASDQDELAKFNQSFSVGLNSYHAQAAPVPDHLWTCNVNGKNLKQRTSTHNAYSGQYGDFSWSHDSRKIVYISQPRPHASEKYLSSIMLVELSSSSIKKIPSPNPVYDVQFTSDDANIIYVRPKEPLLNSFSSAQIFLTDTAGSGIDIDSVALDRDLYLHEPGFFDGSYLASAADGTTIGTWKINSKHQSIKIDMGEIINVDKYLHTNARGSFVMAAPTKTNDTELFFFPSIDQPAQQLTHFNDTLDFYEQGISEVLEWKVGGDMMCDGVLLYPPDFDPTVKYPLVLLIHGGPMSAASEHFSIFSQVLLAENWLVFRPNYRGSDHAGNQFQKSIINNPGTGPGQDIMDGLQEIIRRGIVDENKIAVSGWSYGGFLTSWLIAKHDIWRVAVAGAAVTDWHDEMATSDAKMFAISAFTAPPGSAELLAQMRQHSPISYSHQIKCPTLILSTSKDRRVPVSQSYKLYHALVDNEVETEFILYPTGGHYPGDPVQSNDVLKRWLDWIRQHFDDF